MFCVLSSFFRSIRFSFDFFTLCELMISSSCSSKSASSLAIWTAFGRSRASFPFRRWREVEFGLTCEGRGGMLRLSVGRYLAGEERLRNSNRNFGKGLLKGLIQQLNFDNLSLTINAPHSSGESRRMRGERLAPVGTLFEHDRLVGA